MSSDEWVTDDGINYYHKPAVDFSTTYTFDDEGFAMYADGMDDPVGSITWREEASTGGDTHVPSNMNFEVDRDKEIVFGFEGDTEVDAIRFTKLNGFPQVFAENVEGSVDTISAKAIDFLGSDGQKTGARMVSTDQGELVVVFRDGDGQLRNVDLSGVLMDLTGG